MRKVYQREAARRDLVEHFVYLAENASLDTAERFLAHAEASFDDLAGQPTMGAPLTLKRLELAGLRKPSSPSDLSPTSPPCRRQARFFDELRRT